MMMIIIIIISRFTLVVYNMLFNTMKFEKNHFYYDDDDDDNNDDDDDASIIKCALRLCKALTYLITHLYFKNFYIFIKNHLKDLCDCQPPLNAFTKVLCITQSKVFKKLVWHSMIAFLDILNFWFITYLEKTGRSYATSCYPCNSSGSFEV